MKAEWKESRCEFVLPQIREVKGGGGVKVQNGPDTTARRSARDLQRPKYGTMLCSVLWKFNH
jgi:hypothetical protein